MTCRKIVVPAIILCLTLVNPWNVTCVRDRYLNVSLLKLCCFNCVFWRCDLYLVDLCPWLISCWFVSIYYFLDHVIMWLFGLSLAFHVGKSCCSCSGSWLFYRLYFGSRVKGVPISLGSGKMIGELCLVLTVWPGSCGRRQKIDPSLLLPVCTLTDRGLWCLLIIEMMSWRFISSLWYSDAYHIFFFIGVKTGAQWLRNLYHLINIAIFSLFLNFFFFCFEIYILFYRFPRSSVWASRFGLMSG